MTTHALSVRPPTKLELSVLRDVIEGRDPWGEKLGGSRRISQAIGRCERKGLLTIKQDQDGARVRVVTSAGVAALAAALRVGGGSDD